MEGSGFEVPAEFGRRLRALRKRRGLRQADVALLMGGGRSQALVSQLESGRLKNPTLGLVTEFLRAVQAKFADIADLLDELTAKPPEGERTAAATVELATAEFGPEACRAAKRYDTKVASSRKVAGRRPEPAAKRAVRGRNLARAYASRRRVERFLWQQLTRENLGVEPGLALCLALVSFGIALWSALRRRGSSAAAGRQEVVAEIATGTGIRRVAPKQAVEFVRDSVFRLFDQPDGDGQPTADD